MVDVVLSWSHYTLADQSLLALMPQFQAKGLGVISASPLAMGLLTNRVRLRARCGLVKLRCGLVGLRCDLRGSVRDPCRA